MTTSRERFASRQLRRFSSSFDDQMKESFIDITVASSCDSISDDDSNYNHDSSSRRRSNNMREIERYDESDLVVDCLLGKGGFSNVFQMHHRKTGRVFAVKTLRNSIRQNKKKLSVCAGELAVETAILAKLNHENIIKLHGIRGDGNIIDHLTKGSFFLCLDSLEETLHEKMAKWREQSGRVKHPFLTSSGRRMKEDSTTIKRLENIVLGIVKGMEYLHSKNIIYRDLKPGNIGFDKKTQQIKLFDFGLARVVPDDRDDESESQARLMTRRVGTPRYMAPEIARGVANYDFSVDVYSFSILLWQLVTNCVAFDFIQSPSELKKAVSLGKLRPSIELVPKILMAPEVCEKRSINIHSEKLPRSFHSDDQSSSLRCESKLLQSLIESSWSPCPEKRPTFIEIRKEVEFIINNSAVRSQKVPRRRRIRGFFRKFSTFQ